MGVLFIDKHITSTGPEYAIYEFGKGYRPLMISPFELTRFMKEAWKLITKEMKKDILEKPK